MKPENLEARGERKAPQRKDSSNESRICIADHLEEAITRLRARGYAPSTLEHYAGSLRDFYRYLDGEGVQDLRAVTEAHVEGYEAALRRRKLSSSTRAQRLQAVSRLFEDLIDRGLLLLNPAAWVQRISREDKLPRRVPTERQMQRLLAAANTSLRTGIRDRAILEVLYGSLLRVRELCSLTVYDIDLDNRLVRLRKGKGRKARTLPMGKAEHRWLRGIWARCGRGGRGARQQSTCCF
jgi:integrase/recombinase XerD